jgi:hypothetical protein
MLHCYLYFIANTMARFIPFNPSCLNHSSAISIFKRLLIKINIEILCLVETYIFHLNLSLPNLYEKVLIFLK